VAVRCENPACPAQLQRRLEHFAGRNAMDIEGLGPAVVEQLVQRSLVADVGDLYALSHETLAGLDRLAERSAQNLIDGLQASRERPFDRVLFALGIRHVGSTVARSLARQFGSLEQMEQATEEELQQTPEVGPAIARSVRAFLDRPEWPALRRKLQEAGVRLVGERAAAVEPVASPLAGLTVVLTGTLTRYTREVAAALIESLGGRTAGSVSRRTGLVVAGEGAGSKLDRARELGIEVISEEEFVERLREAGKA
jgi:DNA ligase (NAD+)